MSPVVQQVVAEVEANGPEVLGAILQAACPCLPVAALVALSESLIKMIEALRTGTEQSQVQAAAQAADAVVDAAEAEAVNVGLVK